MGVTTWDAVNWQSPQRGRGTEGHQKPVEAIETSGQKQDERDETASVPRAEATTRGTSPGWMCL